MNIITIKNEKKQVHQIPSRIQTMFGRTGKLSWDRIRDQEGKKYLHFFKNQISKYNDCLF